MNNALRSAHALAFTLALGSAAAQAGVCDPIVPAPCVNEYTIYGKTGAIELVSDVLYLGPAVKLRYMATLAVADAALNVVWTEANGNTLLSGTNMVTWFNTWISWSSEWVGLLLPQPSVTLLTGTADFAGSVPHPNDCPGGSCDAKYYDWDTGNLPMNALAGAQPPGTLTQTSAAFQSIVPSPTEPDNLQAATFIDRFRFTSRVEALAGGWRYVYSFENLSDQSVQYDLSELGLVGTAAAHTLATIEQVSALAPGVRNTAPKVQRDTFTSASGRFDALVPMLPVPELPPAALLLAGLGVVAVRLWRRRPG